MRRGTLTRGRRAALSTRATSTATKKLALSKAPNLTLSIPPVPAIAILTQRIDSPEESVPLPPGMMTRGHHAAMVTVAEGDQPLVAHGSTASGAGPLAVGDLLAPAEVLASDLC
jgi:hypothetical protein